MTHQQRFNMLMTNLEFLRFYAVNVRIIPLYFQFLGWSNSTMNETNACIIHIRYNNYFCY